MLSEAVIKIENQRKEFGANSCESAVAGVLIQLCREMPPLAAAVAGSDKTIKDCVKKMEDYARQHKSGNCGVIDTETGIKIFCEFYGVAGNTVSAAVAPAAQQPKANVVDILDFLE